jgi:hypothetical protein
MYAADWQTKSAFAAFAQEAAKTRLQEDNSPTKHAHPPTMLAAT